MREFTELLHKIIQQTTFDCDHLGVCTSSQLQAMYYRATGLDVLSIVSAKPQLQQTLLTELIVKISSLLEKFTVDGYIGYGLTDLIGGSDPAVAKFADMLIRAGAVLGPERVTQLVFGWADGDPLEYWTHAVLCGVSVNEALDMGNGISFTSLPKSSNEVSAHLPRGSTMQYGDFQFMSAVKVSIFCEARPALFPRQSDSLTLDHTWAHGKIQPFSLDVLCETLSLSCNQYVDWMISWADYGELLLLNTGVFGGSQHRRNASDSGKTELTQEHLAITYSLLSKRTILQNQGKNIDLAISRWMSSKQRISYADRFIELRIALEALYLKGIDRELGFRLATRGAWHLGADFSARRKYQRILKGAYDLGSKAVHTGATPDTEENRQLLTAAQDLCRKGILKRLDEGKEPNWNELVLGKESGTIP